MAGPLVFAGSAEHDASLAKAFWSSMTLQPLLESRLGPVAPREPRERVPRRRWGWGWSRGGGLGAGS